MCVSECYRIVTFAFDNRKRHVWKAIEHVFYISVRRGLSYAHYVTYHELLGSHNVHATNRYNQSR